MLIALFVKDSIPAIEMQEIRNFQESTWCKINLYGGDDIIVGCIYRSPNSTEDNNLKLFEELREIVGRNPSHVLIVGDFNELIFQLTS